jgi:hypothetical protein
MSLIDYSPCKAALIAAQPKRYFLPAYIARAVGLLSAST